MKIETREDILDLLDASFAATAVGAAMEFGLFWLLDDQPLEAARVAEKLGIPPVPCRYWLQMLAGLGLLDHGPDGFRPSPESRSAILDSYGPESWTLLAQESRERLPRLTDLPRRLRESGSAKGLEEKMPGYVERMSNNPGRAQRFTRMLYEIHQPLAKEIAGLLDIGDATRLMDIGGGSGAMSMAFLLRNDRLNAVVVDIPHVCTAGREIAAENGLADRITYHAADFMSGDLPTGFDVVLECDVNVYNEVLFRKVMESLAPGGRFVIIDEFPLSDGQAPPGRCHWALHASLRDPDFSYPTLEEVETLLNRVGFQNLSKRPLPATSRFMKDMTLIEAYRSR